MCWKLWSNANHDRETYIYRGMIFLFFLLGLISHQQSIEESTSCINTEVNQRISSVIISQSKGQHLTNTELIQQIFSVASSHSNSQHLAEPIYAEVIQRISSVTLSYSRINPTINTPMDTYICSTCKRSFTRSDTLARHKKKTSHSYVRYVIETSTMKQTTRFIPRQHI